MREDPRQTATQMSSQSGYEMCESGELVRGKIAVVLKKPRLEMTWYWRLILFLSNRLLSLITHIIKLFGC